MSYLAQLLSTDGGSIFSFMDSYLPTIKFFSTLISLLFFTGIVILAVKLNYLGIKIKQYREVIQGDGISKHRTVKIWKQIRADIESGDPGRRKLAIIEADKVLDEILKLSGYQGESMSDRLKQVTSAQIPNLDNVWIAHKIRNQIAHETGFELTEESAIRAIETYAEAFRQFGLID